MLLLLQFPVIAQPSAADEQQVKDLIIDSFQEILSENKQDKIPQYYTDDFILLEDGEVWDLKIIRDVMDKMAGMDKVPERINSFEFLEVKISGDMAWTAYHNKAVFKIEGQEVGEMNWLESATAIRTRDGWRLQMLHSTVVRMEEKQP